MPSTHLYDLILKLAAMLLGVLVTIPYVQWLGSPVLVIISIFVIYYLVYQHILSFISTYLYCRFSLKMPLEIVQIKQIKNVISPAFSLSMAWPSLKEVKTLMLEERFPKAIDLCENWKSDKKAKRKKRWEKIRHSSVKTKIYLIIWLLTVIYACIASFLNLYPAKPINKFIVDFTGYEIPMFTFIALITISLFLIYLVDKEGFKSIREIDSYDL